MFSNLVSGVKVIRNCLIPTFAAVAVEQKGKSQDEETKVCGSICRPSELPIYTSDSKNESEPIECHDESARGALETILRNARLRYNKYYEDLYGYQQVGAKHLNKLKENGEELLKSLQDEHTIAPKAGAIGIGALTGFIFGLRGGIIKRTVFATTGALGMAAVCYPHEASHYSQVSFEEARKYFTIAYNFVYGVKKGDPPLELPSLPKIPSSFSEAWDSVKSTATSFVSDSNKEKQLETVEQVPGANQRTESKNM